VTAFTTAGTPSRLALPADPYPGLRPFNQDEHRIFFGREEMIDAVIDALARKNLVVVHGASGSGKSSVVRAGVLPWLDIQQGRRRRWLTAIRRPAGGPLRNLASALAERLGAAPGSSQTSDPAASWHTCLALGHTVLDDIEGLLSSKGTSLCLLIDQFEELFRYAKEKSREEAALLTQLLCSLARERNPAPHLFVILTMRSDYLGECARFEASPRRSTLANTSSRGWTTSGSCAPSTSRPSFTVVRSTLRSAIACSSLLGRKRTLSLCSSTP
jgi:hypothetical protein